MIRISPQIAIPDDEIDLHFVRAAGPGGQNVNKVATAVQLRFDVVNSRSLPQDVKDRLLRAAGQRVSTRGVMVIQARRLRTQEGNRQDAVARLVAAIRSALVVPKVRKKTAVTAGMKRRRLEAKRLRSRVKQSRSSGSLRIDE